MKAFHKPQLLMSTFLSTSKQDNVNKVLLSFIYNNVFPKYLKVCILKLPETVSYENNVVVVSCFDENYVRYIGQIICRCC